MTSYDEDEDGAPELTMEQVQALAKQAKDRAEQNKKNRANERQRFLTPDLSFDDMYRQSYARVYHMKTRNAKHFLPDDPGFGFAGRADKLLTKFKHAKKRKEELETTAQIAFLKGEYTLQESHLVKSDEYTRDALWCHYGIGVLYGRFLSERTI